MLQDKSRRRFIGHSGALAVGSMVLPSFSYVSTLGRSDEVHIALIGCRGMGWANLTSLLKNEGTRCVALCDVDQNVLDKRSKDFEEKYNYKPKTYGDYRDVLRQADVDAVIVATPDHWHCKILVDACEAGKDVYVEKPIANSIEESRIMSAAVRKTQRMVQVGQWQRSAPHFMKAMDFVWSGELGNIRLVKTWAYQGWMKAVPVKPDAPVPEGVDYNMWLGPAPARPFNENRFHFTFRWYWDYAGGLMTDWGVHLVDIALWGMKASAPKTIYAAGGKLAYPDDASETPDTLQTLYEYGGFNMIWEHGTGIDSANFGRNHGIAFIGNHGTLVVDRGGWEVIPEKGKMAAVSLQEKEGNDLDRHTANFLACLRSRNHNALNCPIEVGEVAAVNCHMGNVAYKMGDKVTWDQDKLAFTKGRANRISRPAYHNGWKLPQV